MAATCEDFFGARALAIGKPADEYLRTFKPPALPAPYPVKVHPKYSRALNEKTQKWMQDLKVDTHFSPEIYKMLLKMDIPSFAARVYADSPTESGLEWGCKVLYMLWIWDDSMDATAIGKTPEKALSPLLDAVLLMMWSFPDDPVLRTGLEPFLNHMDIQAREEKAQYIESVLADARINPGAAYPKPSSGVLYDVYHSVWQEAIENASREFCLRFAHWVQYWFHGCLGESDNRKLARVSSIDDYIELRRRSSATAVSEVIVEFIYGLTLPETLFQTREMRNLVDAVTDIFAWHNDIWSFKREVLVGKDMNNLVHVISFHRNVSYAIAVEMTYQMVYDRVADFEEAGRDLESVAPPGHRQNVEKYVRAFRDGISGTFDWHANSLRYK